MANGDPRGDIPGDVKQAGLTGTVNDFARALSRDLPRQLSLLRRLGTMTKATVRGKAKG